MNCKNKSFMTKRKAFTLIELLIVIAIIGILFIVLVSKVDFATDKAKATGVQTDFRSFQVALETVAKENAGFNTFGWDTGDTNGDRVRNSYDVGDTNKDGVRDANETWTGRKQYTETWTGVYTLVKPGTTGYDADVIAALESAINKNLDPKLHITIGTDGIITMANGAQDPWDTEYHGMYLSNAANDSKDRGAIIMYSNGANQELGSEHSISNGVVSITVPDNNKLGADDYSLVSVYTYINGYGEVKTSTTGFSNNQGTNQVETNGSDTTSNNGTSSLPTPNLDGTVTNRVSPIAYEWSELKALAQANLSADELRDTYGIEVGDYKEVNGVRYVLVDLDGNEYDGFVFMYNTGSKLAMNSTNTSSGGYAASELAPQIEALYGNFSDSALKSAIKEVTITCNNGSPATATYEYTAHMFLASEKEVGFDVSGWRNPDGYMSEGTCFDLFTTNDSSRAGFMSTAKISEYWLSRSAFSGHNQLFYGVTTGGVVAYSYAMYTYLIVPTFVIG